MLIKLSHNRSVIIIYYYNSMLTLSFKFSNLLEKYILMYVIYVIIYAKINPYIEKNLMYKYRAEDCIHYQNIPQLLLDLTPTY